MILLLARAPAVEGLVRRNRSLLLLGEASYAMYILQMPMWLTVHTIVQAAAPTLVASKPFMFVMECVALIGTSVFLHLVFEKPLRRLLMTAGKPAIPQQVQVG